MSMNCIAVGRSLKGWRAIWSSTSRPLLLQQIEIAVRMARSTLELVTPKDRAVLGYRLLVTNVSWLGSGMTSSSIWSR